MSVVGGIMAGKKKEDREFGWRIREFAKKIFEDDESDKGNTRTITLDPRKSFRKLEKNEILARQDSRCYMCHKRLDPRAIVFDHIIPYSTGGKTTVENGEALCPECHEKKTQQDKFRI